MDGPWHKVRLQRYTETRTPSGHASPTYATYSSAWMKFRTLSGMERRQAQQVNAVQTHEVSMTYCASVMPQVDHRIVWGTRIFDIKDVRNVDEMNTELRLLVHEVVIAGPVSSPSPSTSPSASPSSSPSA